MPPGNHYDQYYAPTRFLVLTRPFATISAIIDKHAPYSWRACFHDSYVQPITISSLSQSVRPHAVAQRSKNKGQSTHHIILVPSTQHNSSIILNISHRVVNDTLPAIHHQWFKLEPWPPQHPRLQVHHRLQVHPRLQVRPTLSIPIALTPSLFR